MVAQAIKPDGCHLARARDPQGWLSSGGGKPAHGYREHPGDTLPSHRETSPSHRERSEAFARKIDTDEEIASLRWRRSRRRRTPHAAPIAGASLAMPVASGERRRLRQLLRLRRSRPERT